MSFEGYYQILCKKGHLSTLDVYDDFEEKQWECRCGAKVAWVNMVDTTNGSFEDGKRIDGAVDLKVKLVTKCDHCDTVLETTYEIPNRRRL